MKVTGPMLCDSREFTHRESMLLPHHFTASHSEEINLERSIAELRTVDTKSLVLILEDSEQSLSSRLAAGTILAVSGDPRISDMNPSMITIESDTAVLGLDFSDVDSVTKVYENIGVQDFWIRKECPRYAAKISHFNIGKYPVTNREYRQFLIETGHPNLPSGWKFGVYPSAKSNHPVYSVDISDATKYTQWLSKKLNRKFRLPTEAEWEYAAAGPERRIFPWGDKFDKRACNSIELQILDTTAVGSFPQGRSWCGALDMGGNVEEMVGTQYHAYPGGELQVDHLNESGQSYHVTRGGCFTRFSDLTRCKRRHGNFPSDIFPIGFRIAEDIYE